MSPGPTWLTFPQVTAFHIQQLDEFGGLSGLRDFAALESALARPANLYAYEQADLPALAAAYAHGIAKNHPFIDGNKRTAFMSAYVFLGLNGLDLVMSEPQAVESVLALASGELSQTEFANLLRKHVVACA
jgi:death on curing protein